MSGRWFQSGNFIIKLPSCRRLREIPRVGWLSIRDMLDILPLTDAETLSRSRRTPIIFTQNLLIFGLSCTITFSRKWWMTKLLHLCSKGLFLSDSQTFRSWQQWAGPEEPFLSRWKIMANEATYLRQLRSWMICYVPSKHDCGDSRQWKFPFKWLVVPSKPRCRNQVVHL